MACKCPDHVESPPPHVTDRCCCAGLGLSTAIPCLLRMPLWYGKHSSAILRIIASASSINLLRLERSSGCKGLVS